MDKCICALPNDAKRYAAQTSPTNLDGLIMLLENHQVGLLSWSCPGGEESMPTEASEGKACHYLTTCWAHQAMATPKFPVRVEQQDTEALLDSGSIVTLDRPGLLEVINGPPIAMACIHGED
ncbi:hypothetical protein AAFF_G00384300 [Aldrovandia affinis]|uniref:Uncharacterized protein n=1 Tax=Aldrovandia affinis TaxID=143900 RepID=A0AAD7SHF2_9TELE|nr:hypothetical protein AAFF_G00384300 [Aldrovandia affinis]